MQALRIVFLFALAQCILAAFMVFEYGITITTILHMTGVNVTYLTALSASIAIYRVFFHRLRQFPGPMGAKITKLYGVYMSRDSRYIDGLHALHQKYGDIVRIGPNELSTARVEFLSAVHGPQSKCQKGTVYWPLHYKGVHNVAATGDKQLHKIRRNVWDRAFTAKGEN